MTEKVASFIAETNYDYIPKDAVSIAKSAILDCLGAALAGCKEPAVKIMVRQVRQVGAVNEAGVIRQQFRTATDLAAWVNGTICHAADYDDVIANSAGYNCHPTVTILPVVLALGEKYNISGKDALLAYIFGVEVESRVGLACGDLQSKTGWHPTSTLGSIGATVAAAKILSLNTIQTQMALGIVSSFAGGLRQNFGTMTKPLHAGNAARNGIVAALLAKNGFTANKNIMEGPFGFCSILSGAKENELIEVEWDLGNSWHIISPGLSFKPYPSCRATHPSIDAMLHLRAKHHIRAGEVAEITCKTSPMTPQLAMHHHPKTAAEGKFSIEYCVAIALLEGRVTLEQFNDEKVLSTEVQHLVPQIEYSHPNNWPGGFNLTQEVMVKLKNGREYSSRVAIPKGEPQNPMTDEELLAKFRDCARSAGLSRKAEQLAEIIHQLESLGNIAHLMEIIN